MNLALFHRLILRPVLRDRMRTGLTVLTVGLGVAVVLAIELAGEAAAFQLLSLAPARPFGARFFPARSSKETLF